MIGENVRKIMKQLTLMLCMLKKENYILLVFRSVTQIVKSYSFNDSKWRKNSIILSYCLNCLNSFATKRRLKLHKIYAKINILVIKS